MKIQGTLAWQVKKMMTKDSIFMSDSLADRIDVSQFYEEKDSDSDTDRIFRLSCHIVIDDNTLKNPIKKLEKSNNCIIVMLSCNAKQISKLLAHDVVTLFRVYEDSSNESIFSYENAKIIKQVVSSSGINSYLSII